jgi:hypothetical protein
MRRVRVRYDPEDRAWIGISNPWGVLAYVDCRHGGAQRAFTELCQGFERAGWQLEGRKFDWQFVNRGSLRWEIRIGVLGPGEKMQKSWGDPVPDPAPAKLESAEQSTWPE